MKQTTTALMLGALTCASLVWADPRNPKPDWVDAASMEYPRDQYVTGVGAADDRVSAEDRARGEIAKVFSTDVSVDTHLDESESNSGKEGASQNQFSQSIAQNVHATSKKLLEGVQIVENWQDSATKVHYALAVLDRAKARTALNEKLSDLDGQAKQWQQQMHNASDKLPKAKAAMKLLTVLKARSALNDELRVIDPSGQGLKGPIDEALVKPEAAKAVAALNVIVRMTGDGADEVETAVVRGLNAFGLHASMNEMKDADLLLEGKVDSKPMQGDGSKWKWARSTVTLSLKDAHTSKIVSRFEASDREASADYIEAVRRCHVELGKRISDEISEIVTAYFENN